MCQQQPTSAILLSAQFPSSTAAPFRIDCPIDLSNAKMSLLAMFFSLMPTSQCPKQFSAFYDSTIG